MSKVNSDEYANAAGTGAPDFPNNLSIAGSILTESESFNSTVTNLTSTTNVTIEVYRVGDLVNLCLPVIPSDTLSSTTFVGFTLPTWAYPVNQVRVINYCRINGARGAFGWNITNSGVLRCFNLDFTNITSGVSWELDDKIQFTYAIC